jgi:hypothetical protein
VQSKAGGSLLHLDTYHREKVILQAWKSKITQSKAQSASVLLTHRPEVSQWEKQAKKTKAPKLSPKDITYLKKSGEVKTKDT